MSDTVEVLFSAVTVISSIPPRPPSSSAENNVKGKIEKVIEINENIILFMASSPFKAHYTLIKSIQNKSLDSPIDQSSIFLFIYATKKTGPKTCSFFKKFRIYILYQSP